MPPPPQTRADRCISADLDQTNLCSSAPDEVRRSAADIPGLHPTMSPRVALVAAAPAAGGNARLSVLRVRAARTRIQASAGAAATASKANPRGAQRGPARPFLRGCPPDAAAWVEASVWTRLQTAGYDTLPLSACLLAGVLRSRSTSRVSRRIPRLVSLSILSYMYFYGAQQSIGKNYPLWMRGGRLCFQLNAAFGHVRLTIQEALQHR